MYQVDIASMADAPEISALRKTALLASREFSLRDPSTAGWAQIDESSVVIVVREGDAIVSSLRMIVFSDSAPAEQFLEYPVTPHAIQGPILVMSRAVTLPSHFSKGFMGAIRYAYLSGAMETKIENVVGVVYQGAPRVKSMQRAGFDLLACEQHWDSEANVTARPLIGVLHRLRFSQALRQTQTEFAEIIDECTFSWNRIHRRFAEVPIHSK